MYVAGDEWIATIETEYLRDFIRAGGASVKFAVAPTRALRLQIEETLARVGMAAGYQVVVVDSAATKIHMIDQFFFAVARQIDWDALAEEIMRRLLIAEGFAMPAASEAFDYRTIAERNDYLEGELRRDVRILLTTHLYRDVKMVHAFRIAMMRLCQARLEPTEIARSEASAVKQWLRGELKLISTLRPALIFQRIARHNARDMFLSLAHMLRLAGAAGLVVSLNIGRYLSDRRTGVGHGEGALFHTTTATLDAYEVLRQFIDATDDLEGCLIVVLAPPEFLEDPKRGLDRYDPLRLRIWDEVHDRRRANPLAALVRLADGVTPVERAPW
jgi:hypothetical protein